MKKNYNSFLPLLIIIAMIVGIYFFMMPQSFDENEYSLSEFSTKRALSSVKKIAHKPHFIGTENHEVVAQYIQSELQKMGLETSFQEGFTLCDGGILVKSKNIIARIKSTSTAFSVTENNKALLLLSHYDSAPHSFSYGASDDASGVATILEGIRTFLYNKTKHKNDIIILFTDAEEIGLNGATLFVTQHKWAKEVGLAINFEARGTSGPSYMLMETNNGNAKMVDAFSKANVKYPVSNSLMYSIYKMLPNDTDLTVFRENGKIQGFNFAFIDSHFNYHTAQDKFENLSLKSLAHQGKYLMPILNYFSNADLSNLESTEENVYFNVPFGFISYPFSWILPMLIIVFLLFIATVFVGLGKRVLDGGQIGKGFLNLIGSLVVAGLLTFVGWKSLLSVYPQYNDILQGFTYNGHDYIYAFVSFSLAICFLFYKTETKRNPEMSQLIAPLFLWLLLNFGIVLKLKGAGFLIIPVISSLLMLSYFVFTQKSNAFLNLLLSIPTLVILVPFIEMFPIGLGLKILFVSAVLTVLTFGLLLPIFGSFSQKKIWSVVFFLLSIGLFIKAHQSATYTTEKAKPNSLLYVLNGDTNKAYWTTYDKNLDEWTKKYLGEKPKKASSLNTIKMYSKYGSEFTFMASTTAKNIAKPSILFLRDTIKGNQHIYKIAITPNRKVNRYDIYNLNNSTINNLKANGVFHVDAKSKIGGKISNKVLSYYVTDSTPLVIEFSINAKQQLDLKLRESSFDLLTNPSIKVDPRKKGMIPMPFVLNDAVIIEEKVKPSDNLEIMVSNLPLKNN